jgi:hypothetical protein
MNLTISTLVDALQYVDPRTEIVRFQYDGKKFNQRKKKVDCHWIFLKSLFFSRRIRERELWCSSLHGVACPERDVQGGSLQSTSSWVSFQVKIFFSQ